MSNDNRLDFSQPASITLNPGTPGSIFVPVGVVLAFGACMLAAFKAGEGAARRGKR